MSFSLAHREHSHEDKSAYQSDTALALSPPRQGQGEGGSLLCKQFGDLISDKPRKWLKLTAIIE
jgi:hypothetical protein